MKSRNHSKTVSGRAKAFWLLSLCILVALALVATCLVIFVKPPEQTAAVVEEVPDGNVNTSVAASTIATSGKPREINIANAVNAGTLTNGSSVEFPYIASGGVVGGKWVTPTNGEYTVTLPKGSYTFQLWGAEGGYGSYGARLGGPGGYATAKLTLTETTTIYIFVGGKGGENLTSGSSGTAGNGVYQGGGYNGGGNWRGYNNTNRGAGGGGATDIRIGGTTYDYRILVAGGGGGGPFSDGQSGKGAGGGASGMDAEKNASGTWSNCPRGKGGTQTAAGGYVGTPYRSSADTSGYSAGTWGEGGKASGDPDSGGGGGGGWFGGGGGHVLGGGGGSGFAYVSNWSSKYGGGKTVKQVRSAYAVAEKYYVTNDSLLNGTQSIPSSADPTKTTVGQKGNGYARIVIDKVNSLPAYKVATTGATINYGARSVTNFVLNASDIAKDDDAGQILYFSNGTATDYDALTDYNATAKTGFAFYLDADCKTPATNYLEWSVNASDKTKVTITKVKRYPQAGEVTGMTNGVIPLYVKVRDSFGTAGKARGCSTIKFNLNVTDNAIYSYDKDHLPPESVGATLKGDILEYTGNTGDGAYVYRLGMSTNTETRYDYVNLGGIYNTAKDIKTLFIATNLTSTRPHGFKINAADIFGDADDADDTGIKAVEGPASTYYNISMADQLGNSGLARSITITSAVRPTQRTFFVLTLVGQSRQKDATVDKAIGGENRSVQLVFSVGNERPYFASSTDTSTQLAEPLIELFANETHTLTLSEIVKDLDMGSSIGFATENGIKVPTHEYVPVSYENAYRNLDSTSNYYDKAVKTDDSYITGEGDIATGFNAAVIAKDDPANAEAMANACVLYKYVGSDIQFTARAATQYQYADAGRLGHFYILVRLVDPDQTNDEGMWYPVAIRIKSSAPKEPSTTANFTIDFTTTKPYGKDGENNDAQLDAIYAGNTVVLTPLSYVSGNVVKGIGSPSNSVAEANHTAKPIAVDDDVFSYTPASPWSGKLNDVVMFDGSKVEDIVVQYSGSTEADRSSVDIHNFFEVTTIPLYASKDVFTNLTDAQKTELGIKEVSGTQLVTFNGLQIRSKKSTGNRYFQMDVNVKDAHCADADLKAGESTHSVIRVYIKVENRDANARFNPNNGLPDSTSSKINTGNYGKYVIDTARNDEYVEYTLNVTDVVKITPYDFVADPDTADGINQSNSNPDNGRDVFNATQAAVIKSFNIKSTANPAVDADNAVNITFDQLVFANEAGFTSNAAKYSDYIDVAIEKAEDFRGKRIPCITITAKSRTASTRVMLNFAITDGFSDNVDCHVLITINNAEPTLSDKVKSCYSVSTGGLNVTGLPEFIDLTMSDLVYDVDGDVSTFNSDSIEVVIPYVVNEGGQDVVKYHNAIFFDYSEKTYTPFTITDPDDPELPTGFDVDYDLLIPLTDYITAELSMDNAGNDVIRITAKSSTQLIPYQIVVKFTVNDNCNTQPKESTLHINVEAVNSAPTFVKGSLLKDGDDETGTSTYTWLVRNETPSMKGSDRYIVNSPELYSANVIKATPANKLLLFSEPDALQRPMLDVAEYKVSYVSNENVKAITSTSSFGDLPVLQTPMYYDSETTMSATTAKGFLNVSVQFYTRKNNGEWLTSENPTDYWAIIISDSYDGSLTEHRVQLAIAVKDNHQGNDTYYVNADGERVSKTGVAQTKVINFYYGYQDAALVAMHEYYRTDPNGEANILRNQLGADNSTNTDDWDWSVDIDYIDNDMYTLGTGESAPTAQTDLETLSFKEDLRYRYFVNLYGSGNTTRITPKIFGDFYYRPITVSGLDNAVAVASAIQMPISYIAMPQDIDTNGTNGEATNRVTFANATINSEQITSGEYKLLDSQYTSWSAYDTDVFENVILTDGKKTWTGADVLNNPYLDIKYISSATNILNANGLVNTERTTITMSGSRYQLNSNKIGALVDSTSIFREDRFGFSFAKRLADGQPGHEDWGNRPSGTLRFSVWLRMTKGSSDPQLVSVDINLTDSNPHTVTLDQTTVTDYVKAKVEMTTSTTGGKYAEVMRKGGGSQAPVQSAEDKSTIVYQDWDTNDTMMFFMPSGTNVQLGSILSDDDIEAIRSSVNNNYDGGLQAYTGKATPEADDIKALIPNPGYENFFTVSPPDGSAKVIRFTPVAKTQINITDEDADLAIYHLKKDEDGKYYYPYKILLYDDMGSGIFATGKWMLAEFDVYIENDTITSKSGSVYEATRDAKYAFTLPKGVDFSVNMSSVLSDNDIALDNSSGTNELCTKAYWDTLGADGQHLKDYLIMPELSTGIILEGASKTVNPTIDDTPITVSWSAALPTTLTFRAQSAFKNPIAIKYNFRETGGSNVDIVFYVQYSNEAPYANKATFGNQNVIDIVMKTGDWFTVYSGDATTFANDTNGSFVSPVNFNKEIKGYPNLDAETLKNEFKLYTQTTYPDNRTPGDLGGLILGDDDAPSTLRFGFDAAADLKSGSFKNSVNAGKFTITPSMFLTRENTMATLPMAIRIEAAAVVYGAEYTLTLWDGSSVSTTLTLRMTVLPTAPQAMDAGDKDLDKSISKVSGEDNTFEVHMNFAERKEIALSSFMKDIDDGDSNSLEIADAYASGAMFKITQPAGNVSSVAASMTTGTKNSLKLEAVDYIVNKGEYATVSFYVEDEHKARSEEITFRVYIEPREPELLADKSRKSCTEVMSYSQSVELNTSKNIILVSDNRKDNPLLLDPDAGAPSAMYNVTVYALYEMKEDGSFGIITESSISIKNRVVYRTVDGGGGYGGGTTERAVYNYILRYMNVSLSRDGKVLTVTPKTATIIPTAQGGANANPIQFYITIGKRYEHDGEHNYGTEEYKAYHDVKIADSAPVATEKSPLNYGYPYAANITNNPDGSTTVTPGTEPRLSDFLTFSGSAGDSLVWDLYNTDPEHPELGLFYDYDIMNFGEVSGALKPNDEILYVEASIPNRRGDGINVPADALKLTDWTDTTTGKKYSSVLSVSSSNNKLTITINRKVAVDLDGGEAYTEIPVIIKVKDRSGSVATTTITVWVENDVPEFKKSVEDTTSLGYTMSYDENTGYVLDLKIKTGSSKTIKLEDIIEDDDIQMDAYSLDNTGDPTCLYIENKSATTQTVEINDVSGTSGNTLFRFSIDVDNNYYDIKTLKSLRFVCESNVRNAKATRILRIRDSARATTSKLTINLTVDNTELTPLEANKEIRIMGVALGGDTSAVAFTDNIINYIQDINPGDTADASADGNTSYTYAYIDSFDVVTKNSPIDAPKIFGPGLTASEDGKDADYDTVCTAIHADSSYHQTFGIMLFPGVYGTQKIRFNVIDSGYVDGQVHDVRDGIPVTITITFVVMRPVEDMDLPEFPIAEKVTRLVTPELLLNKEEGDNNADGYVIKQIVATGALSAAELKAEDVSAARAGKTKQPGWYITANQRQAGAKIIVYFEDINNQKVEKQFAINITENHAPELISDTFQFNKAIDLDDKNMVWIEPSMWFNEHDLEDEMMFLTPVKSAAPALADVYLDDNGDIVICFKASGSTEITFSVTDATSTRYTHTVTVSCVGLPELPAMQNLLKKIQTNPLLYGLIGGGILLLIIILIIILVVIHKKKKMRAEIEALLTSEAELEEEMLRISSGATQYQSYGYLPPTSQAIQDPTLMIGSAPNNPAPNNLQLNAGNAQQANTVQAPEDIVKYPNTSPDPVTSVPGDNMMFEAPDDGFDPDSF